MTRIRREAGIPSSCNPTAFKLAAPTAPQPLPGETLRDLKDRQWREMQLQRDRDHDRSLGPGGRRVPVRYD